MAQRECGVRKALVIGVGNRLRRDDGAGVAVAEALRKMGLPGVSVLTVEGECVGLVELWREADCVFVADAVRGGAPGAIHTFDAARRPLPGEWFRASSHALGVGQAVELARALGRLPERLSVYGIAGKDFGDGEGLSAEVQAAIPVVVEAVRRKLEAG